MNILDLVIIAIILMSGIKAYRKGFIYTIFKALSNVLAIIIAYVSYKPINTILRGTPLYEWLKNLTMDRIFTEQVPTGLSQQAQLISELKLPIPHSIQDNLMRNNNPEVYRLLGVENFKEYIGGYIANFYLSIFAFIILYFVVKSILYILGGGLQIISNLPIIRFADQWAGFGIGIIKGFIGVWIGIIVVVFLIGIPRFQRLLILLSESIVGKWFYENNFILDMIDQLFV